MTRYYVALREYTRKPIVCKIGSQRLVLSSTDFVEVGPVEYDYATQNKSRFFSRTEETPDPVVKPIVQPTVAKATPVKDASLPKQKSSANFDRVIEELQKATT